MGTTEQLIAYFIQKLSGKITKTQLMKLIFLADVESVKFTNTQISDIKWIFHHYGPYDEKLDKRLRALVKEGLISVEQKNKKSKPEEIYFLYKFTGKKLQSDFGVVKKDIIDTIISQFGSFTLDSLLKYVYNSDPVKQTEKGNHFDLVEIAKQNAC